MNERPEHVHQDNVAWDRREEDRGTELAFPEPKKRVNYPRCAVDTSYLEGVICCDEEGVEPIGWEKAESLLKTISKATVACQAERVLGVVVFQALEGEPIVGFLLLLELEVQVKLGEGLEHEEKRVTAKEEQSSSEGWD